MLRHTLKSILFAALLSVNFLIAETGHNFMWKVTDKTNELHLLGSIHALKPGMYPLNKNILNAYDKSDVLAVELDINNVNPGALMGMMATAMYKDGDSLDKHLNKETYAKLKKVMKQFALPESAYSKMTPWFLTMSMAEMGFRKIGADPQSGIDQHFLNKAKVDKKKVAELEGFVFQLKLFQELSKKYPNELVNFSLADADKIEKNFESMVSAWKAGDDKAIEKVFEEYEKDEGFKKISKALMHDRNDTMTKTVKGYIKSGKNYFVVVGAGHLVGETGIVAQLKKAGYKVEQIKK